MELMQWRKAIQSTRLATERNLNGSIVGGGGMDIGTPLGSYSVREEYSGRGSRTAVDQDVIIDSTLAYRLDSCITHITTLQKDFDTYRCIRDRDTAKQIASLEDFEHHLKGEAQQLEHEMREKCSRLELQILESQAKAMKSQQPHQHELVTKSEFDKMQTRLTTMEDFVRRFSIEPPLKHANIVQMVYDEVDGRLEDIKQETASVARRSSSQEIKCKLEFITNNLDEQIKSIVTSVKSETEASLTQFKTQQNRIVDSAIQTAVAAVSQLKSGVDSLLLWKDITVSRLNDLDHDKATQFIKLSQEFHTVMDNSKIILEKQLSTAEDRITSAVESQMEQMITSQNIKLEQTVKQISSLATSFQCQQDNLSCSQEKQEISANDLDNQMKVIQSSINTEIGVLKKQLSQLQQHQPGIGHLGTESQINNLKIEQDSDRAHFQEEGIRTKQMIHMMEKSLAEALLTVRSDLDDVIKKNKINTITRPPLPTTHSRGDESDHGWSSGYDTHDPPSSHERELVSIADVLRAKHTLDNVNIIPSRDFPPQLNFSLGSTPVDGPQPSPLVSPSLVATRNVIQQFNAIREECQLPSTFQLSPSSSSCSSTDESSSSTLTPAHSAISSPDMTSAPTSFEPTSTFLDSIDQSSIT